MARLIPLNDYSWDFDDEEQQTPVARLLPIEDDAEQQRLSSLFADDAPEGAAPEERSWGEAIGDTAKDAGATASRVLGGFANLLDTTSRLAPIAGDTLGAAFTPAAPGDTRGILQRGFDTAMARETPLGAAADLLNQNADTLLGQRSADIQYREDAVRRERAAAADVRQANFNSSLSGELQAKIREAEEGGALTAASVYLSNPGLLFNALGEQGRQGLDWAVDTASDPALLGSFVAQQAPNFLLPIGAARGAGGLSRAAGATDEVANLAATRAALGTGSVLEAGGAATQTRDTFANYTDEQILALPQTADLRAAGYGLDDIRRIYGNQASLAAAPTAALATYGVGALTGGGKVEALIGGGARREAAQSLGELGKRVGVNTAVETLNEGSEEVAAQLSSNFGTSTVDPSQSLLEGTGEAFAGGALLGAGLGGGGTIARETPAYLAQRGDRKNFDEFAQTLTESQIDDQTVLVAPNGVTTFDSREQALKAWGKATQEERVAWLTPPEQNDLNDDAPPRPAPNLPSVQDIINRTTGVERAEPRKDGAADMRQALEDAASTIVGRAIDPETQTERDVTLLERMQEQAAEPDPPPMVLPGGEVAIAGNRPALIRDFGGEYIEDLGATIIPRERAGAAMRRLDPQGKVPQPIQGELTLPDGGQAPKPQRQAVAEGAQEAVQAPAGRDWMPFEAETETLGVPRAEMPQIKAEHRGAMVNFLEARGVAHESDQEVDPQSLKPTQAEFSVEKVRKATEFEGGDRSILVSSDNHVLDGHHQWLGALASGKPIKVIRLNATAQELLPALREFPSSTLDDTSESGGPAFSRSMPWGDFPDAAILRPLGDAKNDPDYVAAKAGDVQAAQRVAGRLVDKAAVEKVRTLAKDRAPILLPVTSMESTGANAIPEAAAQALASRLGLETGSGITQNNRPQRTARDGVGRLANQATFSGSVRTDRPYLIVDDTITQGGTVAQLKEYIELNGGTVVGAVGLTGKQYSAKLKPSDESVSRLRQRFPTLEPWFRGEFGYGFDGLTESEARYIGGLAGTDESVRDRILAATSGTPDGVASGESSPGPVKFSRLGQLREARQANPPGDRVDALPDSPAGRGKAPSRGQPVRGSQSGEPDLAILERTFNSQGARAARGNAGPVAGLRVTETPVKLKGIAAAVKLVFGKDVVVFDADSETGVNGFVDPDNSERIFLNAKANKPGVKIVMHELLHSLRRSDPKAYNDLVRAVRGALTEDAPLAWVRRYLDKNAKAGDVDALLSEADVSTNTLVEEMLADAMGDFGATGEFWSSLADRMEPNLFQRMIQTFAGAIDRIMSAIKGNTDLGSKLYFSDLKRVNDALVEFADRTRLRDAAPETRSAAPTPRTGATQRRAQAGAEAGQQALLARRGAPESVPEVDRSSRNILLAPDAFKSDYGLGVRNSPRKIGEALNKRTLDLYGEISVDDTSAEAAQKIALAMADEVEHQIGKIRSSGVGWYSHDYPKALRGLGKVYPELQRSPGARSTFTAFLAITSNGEKVGRNLTMARQLYETWRDGGDITAAIPGTKRQASLDTNVGRLDALLKEYGPNGMAKHLLSEMRVSEINAFLRKAGIKPSSDYPASMTMPRSALYFGPKLGAFYANLMGSSGYLTMDLWWTRTFNRMRGTLIPQPTEGSIAALREAFNEPTASVERLIELARPHEQAYAKKGYKNGTALEKRSNTFIKAALLELNEAPERASERAFMVDAAERTQKVLARRGTDLSLADIQAALWYYEKRLYGALGSRVVGDIGYLEAFQNAAESDRSERPASRSGESALDGAADGDVPRAQFSRQDVGGSGRDGGRQTAPGAVQASERGVPPTAGAGRAESAGRAGRKDLAPLPGAPKVPGVHGPIGHVVDVAEKYARDNGISLKRQSEFVEVDVARAKRIADAYADMEHAPNEPRVKAAYRDLIQQTTAQYRALVDAGYAFWFIDTNSASGQEYAATPWNAIRDLSANKTMGVFPTDDGFGTGDNAVGAGNPMEAETGLQWPFGGPDGPMRRVLANDLFRAVHDVFGHGMEGAGFRERGEENAWQAHARLFTGAAVGAITSETRGQNSWLNYGPYGEANRTAKTEDTVFAEQKTGLMPEWTWMEGRAGDMQDDSAPRFSRQALNTPVAQLDAVRKKFEGTPQWMKAPNGKPTKLNERQWLQVRTPNFKKWFGDWESFAGRQGGVWNDDSKSVSKVVDENGEPLVVYHGSTNAGFNHFDPETNAKGDLGTFFTSRPQTARTYAGSLAEPEITQETEDFDEDFQSSRGVYPIFLNIRDPNVVSFDGANWDGTRKGQYQVRDEDGDPVYDGNGREIFDNEQEAQELADEYDGATVEPADDMWTTTDGVVREARKYRQDGAIILQVVDNGPQGEDWMPSDVFVIFDSTQAKSATQNTGAFDGRKKDIRFSRQQIETPEFKRWFGDSKVVDAEGKPLVVYHGTQEDFESFSIADGLTANRDFENDVGAFFAEGFDEAGYFARETVDLMGGKGDYARGSNVMPAYLSIKKPIRFDTQQEFRDAVAELGDGQAAYEEWSSEGYDGVHVRDSEMRMSYRGWWIAFEPEQIKSAIGNNGNFDPNDQRITFARAPIAADPWADENKRLREGDQGLWNAAKKLGVRYLTPNGMLNDRVAAENRIRMAQQRGVGAEVQYRIDDLERAVKAEYGTSIDELSPLKLVELRGALAGNVGNLPAKTKAAIVQMRQYIDGQSKQYIAILQAEIAKKLANDPAAQINTTLLDKINSNLGQYVHRSYRVFDDPQWFKRVSTSTVNLARDYLVREYQADGMSLSDARKQADVTVNEILKTDTAYGSMGRFLTESRLGAKDLSVLMRRKDIAPEIRALMGEYADPRINFAKSAQQMGQLILNTNFLDKVRETGMGTFLFEEENRPAGATVQLAGEKSATYKPLNGLWVTPETAQAFEDALGDSTPEGLWKIAISANAMVNYGKTVLSPTTAMRNIQSSFFFTLANGHINYGRVKEAIRPLLASMDSTEPAVRASAQRYIEKLVRMGVLRDGANEGDFRQYIESASSVIPDAVSDFYKPATKLLKKGNDLAQAFYRFGDDFWKIIGWENEKAAQIRAGKSTAEAEKIAAERIINTYPTYSMAPKAVKMLARSPFLGSFPTFSSEVIRTSYHLIRYAAQDIKEGRRSGNRQQLANGMRRAMGLTFVTGLFPVLQLLSAAASGVDDEEDEAVRTMSPPWQENSNILYTGRDADGKLRYFDMSFLDPYGMFKRPFTAMLRDQPFQESFTDAARDFLSPFLGADIAIQAIGETIFNTKLSTGAQVRREGSEIEDTANYIRRALQPGFVSSAERWYNAVRDVKKASGTGEFNETEEMAALLGWRMSKLEPRTALYYRSFDFTDSKKAASALLRRTLTDPNTVDEDDIRDARETAAEIHTRAFVQMGRVTRAAINSGLKPLEAERALRGAGLSAGDARALVRGEIPEFQLSSEAMKNAIKKSNLVQGRPEFAQTLRERFKTEREIAAQAP